MAESLQLTLVIGVRSIASGRSVHFEIEIKCEQGAEKAEAPRTELLPELGHMQCIVTGGEGSPSEAGAKDGGDAEEVAFLYHLGEGCSPKSYGINVARLARLPIEVIQLATRQSQEFEERLKRSSSSSSAEDGSSSITVAARDLLYFFYDRLVSLVGSDMSIAEKASVARDVWTNYKASHAVA